MPSELPVMTKKQARSLPEMVERGKVDKIHWTAANEIAQAIAAAKGGGGYCLAIFRTNPDESLIPDPALITCNFPWVHFMDSVAIFKDVMSKRLATRRKVPTEGKPAEQILDQIKAEYEPLPEDDDEEPNDPDE